MKGFFRIFQALERVFLIFYDFLWFLKPFKGPRGPLKGPRGPSKGPRGPLKGPRGPLKGPRGPFKGRFWESKRP